MKIDNSIKNVGTKPAGPVPKPTTGTTATPPNTSAGGPQVELSSVASHLKQMAGIGSSSEAFNAEKVAEIRQAISEGRFQINPERIADGLINSVRDMLSQRRDLA